MLDGVAMRFSRSTSQCRQTHRLTTQQGRLERFGRQKVQNEIDETRASVASVLDKASAVEARNLRREQELDAREKALTSTLAPSELSDEQRWGRTLRSELGIASEEDALRITSELLSERRRVASRRVQDVGLRTTLS